MSGCDLVLPIAQLDSLNVRGHFPSPSCSESLLRFVHTITCYVSNGVAHQLRYPPLRWLDLPPGLGHSSHSPFITQCTLPFPIPSTKHTCLCYSLSIRVLVRRARLLML